MSRRQERIIRASEMGLYAYCARAWWLGQIEGYQPMNRAALEIGETVHQAHGRAVMGYHRLQRTAFALLGLALLVGFVLMVMVVLR